MRRFNWATCFESAAAWPSPVWRGRAASIQQLDDIALGVGALGALSLGVGVGLYLTTPSATKREGKWQVAASARSLTLTTAW